MNWWTRRLMETVIAIAFFLGALNFREILPHQRPGDSKTVETLRAILEEEMSRRYQAGDVDAYENLFSMEEEPRLPDSAQVIDWLTAVNMASAIGCPGGMQAVPEAPDWFHEELDLVREQTTVLEDTLETGPYARVPDVFPLEINYLSVTYAAKSLRLLAIRNWEKGNSAGAARDLEAIFGLGDALEPDPDLIGQLIRKTTYDIGLRGFDDLVWVDPGPAENRILLAALDGLDFEGWRKPPYTENFLWNFLPFWEWSIKEGQSSIDAIVAVQVLGGGLDGDLDRVPPDAETERIIRETGVFPNRAISPRETMALMSKWTTLPAMRSRAQLIPDSYYQTDPWLPPEAAKQLPPILYLASRLGPLTSRSGEYEYRYRMGVVRARGEAVRAAYRVRVWRNENGHWPSSGQFQSLVGPESLLEYHVLSDPDTLRREFASNHAPPNYGSIRGGFKPEDPQTYSFLVLESMMMRFRDLVEDPDDGLSEKAVDDWLRGILEAQPLVESVSVTEFPKPTHGDLDGGLLITSEVTAHLRLPRKSYWITHPGPDGQPDGPTLEYDPTNGTISRGDIVQLAGWE